MFENNQIKHRNLFLLSILAGAIILIGGIIQAEGILQSLGVTDLFSAVSLSDNDKVNMALYLTFPTASSAIVLWSGMSLSKGHTKRGSVTLFVGGVPALISLFLPMVLGYPSSAFSLILSVIGLALVGVVGYQGFKLPIVVCYPRWFVTVLAHGSQGFVAGLGKGRNIVAQVVLLAISGLAMSTTYFFVNVFIKGYPVALISFARDLFGQSLVSIILGLLLTKSIEKTLPNVLRRQTQTKILFQSSKELN
jgi:hypothetical protein